MSKTKTPNTKQAIIEVLKAAPQATVAQIAVSTNVGRSTAGKLLVQLESEGKVRRVAGGQDGKRRLPDVWSLAAASTSAENATSSERQASAPETASPQPSNPAGGKLKPNGLNPLVIDHLKANTDKPLGPSEIAKALERSSGAVANCLARLVDAKEIELVNEKPRRYSIAS